MVGRSHSVGEYHVFTDTPKNVVLNTVNVGNKNDLQQQQRMNAPGVISNRSACSDTGRDRQYSAVTH